MNLKMCNSQLLIERIEAKRESDGLIYTDDQGMQSYEGTIVATCDERLYPTSSVVIFYEKAGEPVYIDNKKYLMLDSENVWAIRTTACEYTGTYCDCPNCNEEKQ